MTHRPRQTRQRAFQIETLEDRRLMAASQALNPVDDAYEQNDTQATARSLGAIAAVKSINNLVMADKADWYSFAIDGKSLKTAVDIKFTHASGDLDLKVFNAAGKELGASTGTTNAERVTLSGLSSGTYFIHVYGKKGSLNPKYDLTITPSGSTTPPPPTPTIDLVGQSAAAANAASWGSTFAIDAQIKNAGNTASGAFNVQWYLSKDAAGSSDDVRLSLADGSTSYAHPSIAATASGAKQTITLKLPKLAPTGFTGENFYVIMKTDSAAQVAETNENNNFGQLGDGIDREKIVVNGSSAAFTTFNAYDASTDDSAGTVLADGAIRVTYNFNLAKLTGVALEAIGQNGAVVTLYNFGALNSVNQKLLNLPALPKLAPGQWQLRLKAATTTGVQYSSVSTLNVLDSSYQVNGNMFAHEYLYTGAAGSAQVFRGGGGTDTLKLGIARSDIASINGTPYFFSNITANQAIYKGSAYDYLRLVDGREIYFQGIERLQFSDGSIQELMVHPNDPMFWAQTSLHVTDVPSAWRFTQGAGNIMLVSLDTGVTNSAASPSYHGVHDLSTQRFVLGADASEDRARIPGYWGDGHGHMATSVMAGTSNNGFGVAGVNWNSPVYITDVYRGGETGAGMTLQQAIKDAIAYARAYGRKLVFQGGIQGEGWLNDGGTEAELRKLIADNADIALFAIAAGNGNTDPALKDMPDHFYDPYWATSVSGVAKLESTHANVMSVGALERTSINWVPGLNSNDGVNGPGDLVNAWSVDIASYSNRGSNLTLMAPTDALVIDKQGQQVVFGGTSAANPNLAGIASLVWSVNANLTPAQIRQILVDAAHDLGAAGDDNTFGNGLVNADAAVRRAVALARAPELAGLYPNKPLVLQSPNTATTTGSYASAGVIFWTSFTATPSETTFGTSAKPALRTQSAAPSVDALPQGALDKDAAFSNWRPSSSVNRVAKMTALDRVAAYAAHDAENDEVFSLLGSHRLASV